MLSKTPSTWCFQNHCNKNISDNFYSWSADFPFWCRTLLRSWSRRRSSWWWWIGMHCISRRCPWKRRWGWWWWWIFSQIGSQIAAFQVGWSSSKTAIGFLILFWILSMHELNVHLVWLSCVSSDIKSGRRYWWITYPLVLSFSLRSVSFEDETFF